MTLTFELFFISGKSIETWIDLITNSLPNIPELGLNYNVWGFYLEGCLTYEGLVGVNHRISLGKSHDLS